MAFYDEWQAISCPDCQGRGSCPFCSSTGKIYTRKDRRSILDLKPTETEKVTKEIQDA